MRASKPSEEKLERKYAVLSSVVALSIIIFLFYPVFAAKYNYSNNTNKNEIQFSPITPEEAFFSGATIIGIFLLLIALGYITNRSLNKGEMRRAIAGIFIAGFNVLLILSLKTGYASEKITSAYIATVTTIMGFYFGARTVQQREEELKTKPYIGIENVEFRDKQIIITFRNGSSEDIEVDAVYINGKPQKITKTKIKPRSTKEINLSFKWKEGETYSIKICTSEGICSEISFTAPKKKKSGEGEKK